MNRWTDGPIVRSPSTPIRLLLFLLAVSGSWILLLTGFPPGAPDRLPVLAIALVLAIVTARRPDAGLTAFAVLFPCTGLLVRLFGGTDPSTWPSLLFGGLATGWTFRFIYDFESLPDPSPIDRWLRALLAVWVCATGLAVARAATLWAALRGLSGRAVNSEGLLDAEAIRESVFAFSALAAGAAFYFLLRRCTAATRELATRGAIWGVTLSAAAAGLQKLHLLGPETRSFWKLTGRMAGGAIDPNSLGLLCGLVTVIALTRAFRRESRGGLGLVSVALLVAGLLLSGSRSGFLLVLLSLFVLLIARGLPARLRLAGLGLLGAILLVLAILSVRASPGTLESRLAETFDPKLSLAYRLSERPVLWRAAARLAERRPIEGEGMGSFSWRFPDLMREENRSFPMRDNPGSAYVEALAETGFVGFLLTLSFALALGAQAAARIRALESNPLAGGAGIGVVAFLLASVFGSHWYAADASLLFFLLASLAAGAPATSERGSLRAIRGLAVALYAAVALYGILATRRLEETFRYSPRIGFYEQEAGPEGVFRWTKKSFALWVSSGRSERIRLTHLPPIAESTELAVTCEGRTLYRQTLWPGNAILLRLQGRGDRPVIFRFLLSRAFVPRRLRISADRRELGLRAQFLD
jgi:O-antigen ligase